MWEIARVLSPPALNYLLFITAKQIARNKLREPGNIANTDKMQTKIQIQIQSQIQHLTT